MNEIKILPEDVANKIAAGEVVERPVNVVKELVENSIDAGADDIKVEIRDGGISYIKVSDNGRGILKDDLKLCVLRFATSKIESYDDLFKLNSYGFRGEALAAISSVSNFSIQSGEFLLEVDFGNIKEIKPAPFVKGTQVVVKNLFGKIPARMKFLKTATSEQREIVKFIKNISLLNPNVKFSLTGNGKILWETGVNESVFDRAVKVFGEKELVEFENEYKGIKVSGVVSLPTVQKFRRDSIVIGVNGRVVKDAMITQAVIQAYHRKLPENRFPVAVINIKINPDFVDVNVHPAKLFVKFYDSNSVFKAVMQAVSDAIKKDSDTEIYNESFEKTEQINLNENISSYVVDLRDMLEVESVENNNTSPFLKEYENYIISSNEWKVVGQLFDTVIIVEKGDEVLFIDQHIAHERVLYENLLKNKKPVKSVYLVEPFLLRCDEETFGYASENIEKLEKSGFDVEVFGNNLLKVNAVPSQILNKDLEQEIKEILKDSMAEIDVEEPIFLNISCKCAVKAGERLLESEMVKIVDELFKCENPYTCPHGRPIIFKMCKKELFKKFHR